MISLEKQQYSQNYDYTAESNARLELQTNLQSNDRKNRRMTRLSMEQAEFKPSKRVSENSEELMSELFDDDELMLDTNKDAIYSRNQHRKNKFSMNTGLRMNFTLEQPQQPGKSKATFNLGNQT